MQKLFLVFQLLLFVFNISSFAQPYGYRSDNLLLPDRLIVCDHIPFDSSYCQPISTGVIDSTAHPYFEISKQFNLVETLVKKAIGGQISVYDAEQVPDLGPYTGYTPLNDSLIRIRLGEKLVTVMTPKDDDFVEETRLIEISFEQLTSIYSVEEWAFTVSPLHFDKKVVAYMPVRCYGSEMDENELRFVKTFCFMNPQNQQLQQLQPAAKIQYEYIFNQPQSFMHTNFANLIKNSYYGNEDLYNWVLGAYNSPYFNATNQQNFITTLINQVIEGKTHTCDYRTKQPLTALEAKDRIFTHDTISVMDENGEFKDMVVEHNRTDQIYSILFIEEWSIDPLTMQLEKKVTGIAPIRYFPVPTSTGDDKIRREVVFIIDMDN